VRRKIEGPKIAAKETPTEAIDLPVVEVREQFESFYQREYRPVLAIAHVLSGSPSLAEELTQEAFMAAYRDWDRIEKPEGWVRTVVSNRARSLLRRRYAEARALAHVGPDRVTTVDEMSVDAAHFWAEVRRLPTRQAQAIALLYLEDRSVTDTAAVLGCSESTARVHLMRGRKALAERLAVEET
jgi:RNA polymerase sigma-70 factor (ECF subfamily)